MIEVHNSYPLKSKTAEEVAYQLMGIICMFGAPFIPQSDNVREFANKIIQNFADMWPGMKLVHGKPRYSQSKDQLKDPTKMFKTCWLFGRPTTTRKPGLKDYDLSKARKNKFCIQASRQALMRLRSERRRGSDLGILSSLNTCTVQQKLKKNWNSSLIQERIMFETGRQGRGQPTG